MLVLQHNFHKFVLQLLACFAMQCNGTSVFFQILTMFLQPAPPPPRIAPAPNAVPPPLIPPAPNAVPPPRIPRRAVDLLERRKYVGEEKTRLASQIDCYGYTYGRNNIE